MALVTCPDCNKDVSDAAPACPNCGRPMAPVGGVQTIEATGKKWKAFQLGFGLMTVVGIVIFFSSLSDMSNTALIEIGPIGMLMFVMGFFGYLVARIGAWWKHG